MRSYLLMLSLVACFALGYADLASICKKIGDGKAPDLCYEVRGACKDECADVAKKWELTGKNKMGDKCTYGDRLTGNQCHGLIRPAGGCDTYCNVPAKYGKHQNVNYKGVDCCGYCQIHCAKNTRGLSYEKREQLENLYEELTDLLSELD